MSWNNPPPPPFPPFPFGFPPSHGPPHGPPPHGPPPGLQEFLRSFRRQPHETGYGIDHTTPEHGFEFGPGGFSAWTGPLGVDGAWGRRGRGGWGFGLQPRGGRRGGRGHGRHGRRDDNLEVDEEMFDITAAAAAAEAEMEEAERDAEKHEKDDSPATMRDADADGNDGEHPDPPEETPSDAHHHHHHHRFRGRGRGFGCRRGGRGHHGFAQFGGPPFPPFGGPHAGWFPFGPAGHPGGGMPDFRAMAEEYGPRVREWIERFMSNYQNQQGGDRATTTTAAAAEEEDGSFTPPIDVFDTRNNWTVHVALPGAKKEDVGVNWDADRSTLTISGVVHRPGDEEFLGGMVSSERRIGLFERTVQLPPPTTAAENGDGAAANKDEVDGDNIMARMEDGILVVVVPKVEKEWTEIKKVDIL